MNGVQSQQYFWGCKLDVSNPEETWSLPENAESSVLRVTQIVLGENPSEDRHLIKVRTKGHNEEEYDQALFNLQLGKTEQISTDFYFTADSTFQLAIGSGPVYLSGYQSLAATSAVSAFPSYTTLSSIADNATAVSSDEATENSLKRRHSESEDAVAAAGIPKNMKLIKMSRASICNNIKMDPRNPEGFTDLWVGNVHPDITDDVLRELFGRYGRVVSCHVLQKKYCAFINYATKESAGKAMGALQNNKFYGVPLVIKFPEKRMGPMSHGVGGGGAGGNPNLTDMFPQELFSPAMMSAVAAQSQQPPPVSATAQYNRNMPPPSGPPPGSSAGPQSSSNYFKV